MFNIINEASKIGIAMDIIDMKIGQNRAKLISTKEQELSIQLEKEYSNLKSEKEQIYNGNINIINKVLNEAGGC